MIEESERQIIVETFRGRDDDGEDLSPSSN